MRGLSFPIEKFDSKVRTTPEMVMLNIKYLLVIRNINTG